MLDEDQVSEIREYRHHVRLTGCWGGCYEVSSFIEHRFGLRRRDGVFRLPDGIPVFLHSWNEAGGGLIIDATADQFGFGWDIAQVAAGASDCVFYTPKYTSALNPSVTPWLAGHPYSGVPDRDYWQRRYDERRLGPGWWLDNNRDYCDWLRQGAGIYPVFAAKLAEYKSLGYAA